MDTSHQPALEQQRRVRHRVQQVDAYAFFNVLTGPQMLDGLEELLPVHRERLFPPTETLSMFLAQVLAADGSCQQAVDDAAVKRVLGSLPRCSSRTSAYCQARLRLPTELVMENKDMENRENRENRDRPRFSARLAASPPGFPADCHVPRRARGLDHKSVQNLVSPVL